MLENINEYDEENEPIDDDAEYNFWASLDLGADYYNYCAIFDEDFAS